MKVALCLIALLLAPITGYSQGVFDIKETYVYGGLKSGHVYDNGFVGSDSATINGGAVLRFENGMYIDLFGITPLKVDSRNKWSKETDVTVGWKGNLGVVRTDVAFVYDSIIGPDVYEVVGEISPVKGWSVGDSTVITPFVQAKVINSSERNLHNELLLYGGVYANTKITEDLLLRQMVKVGHHPELPWASETWNANYKIALQYKVLKDFMVGAEIEHFHPLTNGNIQGREPENVFGINAGYTFK